MNTNIRKILTLHITLYTLHIFTISCKTPAYKLDKDTVIAINVIFENESLEKSISIDSKNMINTGGENIIELMISNANKKDIPVEFEYSVILYADEERKKEVFRTERKKVHINWRETKIITERTNLKDVREFVIVLR